MTAVRVPDRGSAIDRGKPIAFRFDGRALLGYAGDTLASALLANGVEIVGRSFKLHRPRGVMAAGPEEPNAFVRLVRPVEEPNALATSVPLVEGLEARSVHGWPRAGLDGLAAFQSFGRLLPAGFYYKTFIGWRGNAWPRFEPLIRRLAGLGPAPQAVDPLPSENRYDYADVVVVGGGPAGIAAASAAARSGVSVLLAEDSDALHQSLVAGWHALGAIPQVRLLRNASALGVHHDHLITIHERRPAEPFLRDRLWKVRAGCVVLATGAVEQPVVVAGNDRPGVMLAEAAERYLDLYGVRAGDRIVLICNNAQAIRTAARLREAGAEIAAVVTTAADVACPSGLTRTLFVNPATVSIRGGRRVRGVRVTGADKRITWISCDLVLLSGGSQPALQLWTQAGGRMSWSEGAQAFLPAGAIPGTIVCGAAAGTNGDGAAAASGTAAGEAALRMLAGGPGPAAETLGGPGCTVSGGVAIRPGRPGEAAFVDIHNDVTWDDLQLALAEGYRSIDHVKRYTTLGMGPDQGRTSARNGAVLSAGERPPPSLRTTTMRPPWRPVPFSAVAGSRTGTLAAPWRSTPLTPWALENGAVFYEAGASWRRPGYFPREGEALTDAVRREVTAVRTGVGIYDSSPLGKILVRGRDSGVFLDLVYATRIGTLKPMTGRYGLMLREDGRILDDGVVFRDSEHQFTLTTTTGNAATVLSWLEYLRSVEFPGLDVRLLDIGEPWAAICLCGPAAREVLAELCDDVDLSRDAFPFMAARTGHVAGHPARLQRVSFTGELSFEIWTSRRNAAPLWSAAFAAGGASGLTAVGSEANHVLRVEKGFLSVGHEVDGYANPFDLGLDRFVAMGKPDFVGRRALLRDRAATAPRPELVGLLTEDDEPALPEGAPVVSEAALSPGFVTAAVASPTLARPVALALLEGGRARIGDTVDVMDGARARRCTVTAPVFVDPDGVRLRS